MNHMHVPHDDLIDVLEMSEKLEGHIFSVLNENESFLGKSALVSASVNCLLMNCKTADEAMFYRHIFIRTFDTLIDYLRIRKGPDGSHQQSAQ
jgi:hypothetical protein